MDAVSMQDKQVKEAPYYFIPQPSRYPILAGTALLFFGSGMSMWVNHYAIGPWCVLAGGLGLLTVLYFWFGNAIAESEGG